MMNRDEKISKNFTWQELVHSDIALTVGIDNVPSKEAVNAMFYLVTQLLQPLREHFKKKIQITSGYRSAEVNWLVGGVPNSQHLYGEAVDCHTEDNERLLEVLKESGLIFDQAILYKKRNILHLSLKREGINRKMILIK